MKKYELKKKLIICANVILFLTLPILMLTVNVKSNTVSANTYIKKISTNKFNTSEKEVAMSSTIEKEEDEEKEDDIEEKEITSKVEKEELKEEVKIATVEEQPRQEVKQEIKNDVLATYTGTMSFYNENCSGCSGNTSSGVNVSGGRLYYHDSEYQNVRIVAAGREIKLWSIVRIKNSSLGDSVLAIVLDRGGDIGNGKKFIIDMLTNNQENKGGINKNVTVEVLRNGK